MGQKVNPTGFRTGVMIGWKSRWFASKREFADLLVEDHTIREFIKKRKYRVDDGRAISPSIARIEIERTRDEVKVVVYSAHVGVLMRDKGKRAEELQTELQTLTGKQITGSIPLSTLRAKIDYGFCEAKIAQGHIGIQVWINLGTYSEDDINGLNAETSQTPKKPKRAYKR